MLACLPAAANKTKKVLENEEKERKLVKPNVLAIDLNTGARIPIPLGEALLGFLVFFSSFFCPFHVSFLGASLCMFMRKWQTVI